MLVLPFIYTTGVSTHYNVFAFIYKGHIKLIKSDSKTFTMLQTISHFKLNMFF